MGKKANLKRDTGYEIKCDDTDNGICVDNTDNYNLDDDLNYVPDAVIAADALDAADNMRVNGIDSISTDTISANVARGSHTEAFVAKMEKKFDDRTRHKRDLADGFKKNKVVNEVLDKSTVMTLYKMITSGILSGVNGTISAGKESLVFWGLDSTGANIALKIYLVSTSNFKRRKEYMLGDPRFASLKKGTRNIVYLWAKKEFRNLKQCAAAGIPVPKPIHVANNVLAMEFIDSTFNVNTVDKKDTGFHPAVQLLHSSVNHDDYMQAISIITDMYKKANLVHGDYSEYNIFKVPGRGLIVFDLGSAVHKNHPNSAALLKRDINNILRFFKKKGIKVNDNDASRIMEDIVS